MHRNVTQFIWFLSMMLTKNEAKNEFTLCNGAMAQLCMKIVFDYVLVEWKLKRVPS